MLIVWRERVWHVMFIVPGALWTGWFIQVLVVCGCSLSSWWRVGVVLLMCPRVKAAAFAASLHRHKAISMTATQVDMLDVTSRAYDACCASSACAGTSC